MIAVVQRVLEARVIVEGQTVGAIGPGMLEETRAMPDLDRLQTGNAGANDFSDAAIAGHQVRLDQASRDLQIRVHVTLVDVSRYAVRSDAEEFVIAELFAEVDRKRRQGT